MLHKLHTDRKVLMNLVSYILRGLHGVKYIRWKSCVTAKYATMRLQIQHLCGQIRGTRLIFATLVTLDPSQGVFCLDAL